MFKFATKLLMANALKLEQGEIKIFNQPVVMLPADVQVFLIKAAVDSLGEKEGMKMLYESAKKGTFEYCENLKKNTNSKGTELSDLYKGIVTLAGYGVADVIRFDSVNKVVICRFSNSPIVNKYKELFGVTKLQVDIITLGLFAGSYNSLFDVDFDAIEAKCSMQGGEFCEFVFAEPNKLKKIVQDKKINTFLDFK
jgi:hypothetical protein